MEKEFLEQIAKDHARNILTRDDAKTFLKELRALCDKHKVLLRTDDQIIRFSKNFNDATLRLILLPLLIKW
ncbi:MAG: hypothetical protein CM15mP62_32540 [Rhodospirillaceae bacterium]|nr:MAG: hypothetical protein CM15mP62_32540 [Rhodospirillaceae bacterium]